MDLILKNILQPASILAGIIIGAGVFSLPFVFLSAGLATSFFYLIFFGIIYILLYYIYADVIIRTPGEHRFVGYADIYLGKAGFALALAIGLLQLFFVMTIYLILAPSFSKLFISGDYIYHLLVFWLAGSALIFLNSKRLGFSEFLIVAGIALIMAAIFLVGLPGFLSTPISFGNIDLSAFLSVGPILFALSGSLAIPEIIAYFREAKIPLSLLKKSLALGGIIPIIAYGAFVIGILGLSNNVSEDSVSGLIGNVSDPLLWFIGILGILSLISSYLVVGTNVRKIIQYDLNMPALIGGLAAVFIPLILYSAGLQSFLGAVSFVGALFLPLESVLLVAIWLQADKKSEAPPMFVGRWTRLAVPGILLVFFISLFYGIM